MSKKYVASQTIRDYMAGHGIAQSMLVERMSVTQPSISYSLKQELSNDTQNRWLKLVDEIYLEEKASTEEGGNKADNVSEVSRETAKFQIGEHVKISSKANKAVMVMGIWASLAKSSAMYTVVDEAVNYGLYAEERLEPASIPISYRFAAHIDGNAAVFTMVAAQDDQTWIRARGHAHIIHDGEVGLAQAVSFAANWTRDRKEKSALNVKPRAPPLLEHLEEVSFTNYVMPCKIRALRCHKERNIKMKLDCFKKKLKDLHEKSGMDAFLDWPFVYDEDEDGRIYVDDKGTFWFADNCSNWIESPLRLSDVMNLRYAKDFEEPGIDNEGDEPSESIIYIHFSSGNSISLWNVHDTYSVEIAVCLHRSDMNTAIIDQLKAISRNQLEINVE